MAFGDQLDGFGTGVAAAGLDHVRLSYTYLDRDDPDGYASLLDPAAVLDEPGHERVRGPGAVAALRRSRGRGEHHLHDVFAADGRVAAVGRFRGDAGGGDGGGEVDFADIFTLSEHGLLVTQRCFYFVHPR
jgi:hypothetical protein